MSSSADQEHTEPDDINVGLIATIAIVGALLVLAIAMSLTALVRAESTEYGDAVGAYADLGVVRRLKAEQTGKLEAPPTWVDKAKGQVTVPIDRAMEVVTAEIEKDPSLATVAPPASAETAPAPGTDTTDAAAQKPGHADEVPGGAGAKDQKVEKPANKAGQAPPANKNK